MGFNDIKYNPDSRSRYFIARRQFLAEAERSGWDTRKLPQEQIAKVGPTIAAMKGLMYSVNMPFGETG
jgi:hypothetical protein